MRILLSNDDGIASDGLRILKEEIESARRDAEIWVVAPDGERSGKSHSITLKDAIRSRRVAPRQFQTSGSPADCVMTGILGIMDGPPDIVISGINYGPNLGTDLTYSGTAAAARQGAYMNYPSVAVSLVSVRPPFEFRPLAKMVARNIERFIELWDEHHFININGPGVETRDIRITHPCRRIYNDRLHHFDGPDGDQYWFLAGEPDEDIDDPGSDLEAVLAGAISISPVHLHPVNNLVDEEYEKADFQV
jgi:5'-nucleotidase